MKYILIGYYFIILVWLVTKSTVHEAGHLFTAWKHKKVKAVLAFKGKDKEIIRTQHLVIIKSSKLCSKGQTFLENDYQDYKVKEIRRIAKAGFLYQTVWMLFLNLIYLTCVAIFVSPYLVFYIIPLSAALMVYVLWLPFLPMRKDVLWNDRQIMKNPSGFLQYMREEESTTDKYSYVLQLFSNKEQMERGGKDHV